MIQVHLADCELPRDSAEKRLFAVLSLPGTSAFDLLARRRNIDVDLLSSATAKEAASERKEHHQNNDHKNRKYCYNSRTATASAVIVSHEGSS